MLFWLKLNLIPKLFQACIDDNLEMVEFLIEHDADVNRGDNEGWTPLHATASCGFLSIARYVSFFFLVILNCRYGFNRFFNFNFIFSSNLIVTLIYVLFSWLINHSKYLKLFVAIIYIYTYVTWAIEYNGSNRARLHAT